MQLSAAVDLHLLNKTFGISDRLRFEQSSLGGPVAVLQCDGGRVTVALHGGQVLEWQPAGHDPVLWLSPVARLGTGTALRGGIPVCWPWFGPRPIGGDPAARWPQHGFARTALWSVCGSSNEAGLARLQLRFSAPAPAGIAWLHAAEVQLTIDLADVLTLTLETTNNGAADLDLTQALHSYFHVGDIGDVRLEGLEGCGYHDAVTHGPALSALQVLDMQRGAVTFAGEVNRVYTGRHAGVTIVDPGLRRAIGVTGAGSGSTVIWNPAADKGAALGDLGPEGWRRMLCVETANTVYDRVRVAPGARTKLVARIAVLRL